MSRRHRILAWVKTDAQRMKDEAILAKVTARIMRTQRPNLSASQVWSAALSAQVNDASVFADMIDRVVYDFVKGPAE